MTERTLQPTLGLFSAVMLALSVVVGAGMLMLPGLVYQVAGRDAYWSWVGDALISVPLLWVLIRLGRQFPSAGGVANFVGVAWPRARAGVAFVLLGTFGLGIPSIALTGGYYVVEGLGLSGGAFTASLVATVLLVGTAVIIRQGATLASGWQNVLMIVLLAILTVLAVSTLPHWEEQLHWPHPDHLPLVWGGMALAFFSFTGWELFAALAEEMKNPRRDFPLAVILSFVVVATLYVGAALAVQSAAVPDDPLMARAPFLPVITRAIGGAVAEPALAALVFLVIASSLVGNVWAASRLVFDMGRSGYLPAALGADRFDGRSTPQRALYTVSALFLFTIAVHFFFGISLDLLLKLAGQNFFMLYVACVFVFVKVVSDWWEKAFALLALIGLLAFTRVFGWGLIYPAVLFAVPYIVWRGTVPPVR